MKLNQFWGVNPVNAEQPCPVCSRLIKSLNPQKGDLAYEDTYCSKYCRLFHTQKLKMVPFDGDSVHHKNKLRWPHIVIDCDMCGKDTLLLHDIERSNRTYCSTKCWNTLKASQKRGIQRTINMLSLLHHRRKYHADGWMTPTAISERCGRKGQMCSPTSVGLIMKRWRTAGIVDARLQGGSSNGHEYRFLLKGLKNMTLAKFIYTYNTLSYADRMEFMGKSPHDAVAEFR